MTYIKGTMHQDAKPTVFGHAKKLRYEKMTPQEIKLWARINKRQILGQRFRRQHPISSYVLDFFCPACKLSIEIDGLSHDNQSQIEYDFNRTQYLETIGIIELRFKNEQIDNAFEDVVNQIKQCIERMLI